MELRLGLDQREGIWIDGSHRIFERTDFEGLKFRVKITNLTRSQIEKFGRDSEKNGKVNQNLYMPRVFMACCQDWELKDHKGQPLPFNEENKKKLVEQFPGLTNLIAAACLDAFAQAAAEAAEKQEAAVKN